MPGSRAADTLDPSAVDEHFDQTAGPVWRELRGRVWHRTGSHRFRGILKVEEIQAEPVLEPGERRWAELGTTLCRSLGSVSLFDFAGADWDRAFQLDKARLWVPFLHAPFTPCKPEEWVSTVWLAVDTSRLQSFVSPIDARKEWLDGRLETKWMPCIEACSGGPISLTMCTHAVVVCAVERKEFRRIDLRPPCLDEIEKLETDWRKRFAESYAGRALPVKERILLSLRRVDPHGGTAA